jgi:alpha-tubulin suppressor-like RCC1 family protein
MTGSRMVFRRRVALGTCCACTAALAAPASAQSLIAWGVPGYSNIDDLRNLTQVSAGFSHSVGLKPDGSVACWGYSPSNQCVVPLDLGSCQSVVAGGYHTIALRHDGTVRCWGANDHGQSDVPASLPTASAIGGGG